MADFMRIEVKNGLDQMLDGLEKLEPRNIPFATAMALTKTAKAVEQFTRGRMADHIDRPTPFTRNSMYTKPATKQDLSAVVQWKQFAGKGAPAGKYLEPIVEGKPRGDKSTERKLKRAGVIGMDQYLVPAKGMKLNAYGNIPAPTYVQVLSYLKASGESGFLANRTKASALKNKKQKEFFVVREKGQGTGLARSLPPGIYQRMASGNNAVKLIFALVRQPRYTKRYPFYEEAQEQAVVIFPKQIQAAIEFVLNQVKRR